MPKVKIPNGRGGYTEIEAKVQPGETADEQKQTKRFKEQQATDFWSRVSKAAEKFNQLEKALGTEMSLTEDEMVAAKYLDLLNWQHFFPQAQGGPAHVEELCRAVQDWFKHQLGN